MTTRAHAVLKWRRKKVEVCLFSEFISWWNNAIRLPLAGSTFWQNHSEKSPLISSLAIPGHRGWIWIVQDCCFPSVEGALDTLTSTEKFCWRRLGAWRMFFLGELGEYWEISPLQRTSASERASKFYLILSDYVESMREFWSKMSKILAARFLSVNTSLKATLQLRLTLYMMMKH